MVHETPLPRDLEKGANVTVVRADLARPETLADALREVGVVVHFAGVLFAPRPERFLPETNTQWFANLLAACLDAGVSRVILVSFPHVEGPTSVESPATGRLDREPLSAHARTRLAEERLLIEQTRNTTTTPVILRLGMVYGDGILMIEAARWLARHRLLAVWKDPTWIHLVSTPDFLAATEAAITRPNVCGIYHIGDDQPVTLQHFLDRACRVWQLPKPYRLPVWMIYTAAYMCELAALVARKPSPLTRDFITIGRVSYFGDTRRAREELIPELQYPTLENGAATLVGEPSQG
jgi:nucleoside-diphosphate-sugar epimerase